MDIIMSQEEQKGVDQKQLTKSEKKSKKTTSTTDDYLDEDPPIKGQKYVLLSFLSPERVTESKPGVRGVKIRGVFATREEAEAKSKSLRDTVDSRFDIYVGEIGKWLAWDSRDHTEQEIYAEEELNRLMGDYLRQQDLSKEELEKRRRADIEEAVQRARQAREKEKAKTQT